MAIRYTLRGRIVHSAHSTTGSTADRNDINYMRARAREVIVLCAGLEMIREPKAYPPSPLVVVVVTAPPHARLVASLWRAIEPLIHAPEGIHASRKCRVGVVDDAVLEHERAHAWPFAYVGGDVGSGHERVIDDRIA